MSSRQSGARNPSLSHSPDLSTLAVQSHRCQGRGAGVCRLPIPGAWLLHVWRSGSNGTVAPPRAGSVGRDVSPPLVSAVVGPMDTVPSPVSVRKPPRFRGKSWKASPIAYSSETPILQDFLGTLGIPRSACHAEGRGFESLQPLSRRPAFAGLFHTCSRLLGLRTPGPRFRFRMPSGRRGARALRARPDRIEA